MNIGTLTIVGVGLIGGSIGLAAKKRGLVQRVLGVGWRQATLDQAKKLGAIDEGSLDLISSSRVADLIVFCTPVDRIVEQALTAASVCRPGTMLTDAGSTKGMIVKGIKGKTPQGISFVGSHPLAGSEKRGPEHADASLFQGRLTLVTPTAQTDPAAKEKVAEFWRSLGSRVRFMDPEEHDRALAMTSHLPHLLASALAGILPQELFDLTATGYRDTTRIAAGDPNLWSGIFMHNKPAVLAALESLRESLARYQTLIQTSDAVGLNHLLEQAKKVRDALGS